METPEQRGSTLTVHKHSMSVKKLLRGPVQVEQE